MSEQWKCPAGKPFLEPTQVIATVYPEGRPHLTLPIHKDGTLCGPWCQEAKEAEDRAKWCDGKGEIRRSISGVYGPGTLIGYCEGCPNCDFKGRERPEEEVIQAAYAKLRKGKP